MKEQENLFFLNFFVSILFNLICGLQIHLKAGNCFLKIKKKTHEAIFISCFATMIYCKQSKSNAIVYANC